MILLIADDEKRTREGIRSRLDLEKLGISQVLLADDGARGLELALSQHPHIVLTDVRMPRMNGVEMAEKILEARPGTVIIFMSAYSDKEYLKAAIKLKAVSYVEKPLDMAELEEALITAVADCRRQEAGANAARLQEKDLMSHIITLLTEDSIPDTAKLAQLIGQLHVSLEADTCFAVMILDCVSSLSHSITPAFKALSHSYKEFLDKTGLLCLSAVRADRYVINLFFSPCRINEQLMASCASYLQEQLTGILPRFFLALGPSVCGIDRVYISYREAWHLIRGSFFQDYGSILMKESLLPSYVPPADLMLDFTAALTGGNEALAQKTADELYGSIRPSQHLYPDQIRDLYYRYLGKLEEISLGHYLSLWQREGMESESIWEGVRDCATLKELHSLLKSKLALYFRQLYTSSPENPLVFQIKDYIHQNYSNPSLSVPDVSQHVHLSSSYVCTIFKNETGQTLNQYLTDYRIKMSKQLLSSPLYKISDISLQVGYSDGNYYSRTFKKIVGLSPSEYREKMLHD